MIIVSQDKKAIINFDNINWLEIDVLEVDKIEIFSETSDSIVSLGYYKTIERAKEVLQEITKTYLKENCEFECGMYHEQKVYEMPKE